MRGGGEEKKDHKSVRRKKEAASHSRTVSDNMYPDEDRFTTLPVR